MVYVKTANDLQEISQLEILHHGPTEDSIVKKLPGMGLKFRWSTWLDESEEGIARQCFYVVFKEIKEKDIKRARVLTNTMESAPSKEKKAKYSHFYKTRQGLFHQIS